MDHTQLQNDFLSLILWDCNFCAENLRVGHVSRVTKETSVDVKINLDGTGICECDTGIPFLDHMLDVRTSPFTRLSHHWIVLTNLKTFMYYYKMTDYLMG